MPECSLSRSTTPTRCTPTWTQKMVQQLDLLRSRAPADRTPALRKRIHTTRIESMLGSSESVLCRLPTVETSLTSPCTQTESYLRSLRLPLCVNEQFMWLESSIGLDKAIFLRQLLGILLCISGEPIVIDCWPGLQIMAINLSPSSSLVSNAVVVSGMCDVSTDHCE